MIRTALLGIMLIAGCLGGPAAPDPAPATTAAPDPASATTESRNSAARNHAQNAKISPDGTVQFLHEIHVVTLGFEESVVAALRAKLGPTDVHHVTHHFPFLLPADRSPSVSTATREDRVPLRATADYRVYAASADLARSFYDLLPNATIVEGASPVYDANLVEAWLLERRHELAPAAKSAPLVLLSVPGNHAYRYTFTNGHLEPVRYFGERGPLLAFDVTAAADPFTTRNRAASYDRVLQSPTADHAPILVDLVHDATHYRLLQGPIYPISLRGCHGVTFLFAVRETALADRLPGLSPSGSLLAKERLERTLGNVTGADSLKLDVRVLRLPQDDPPLEIASRGGMDSANHLREWLSLNFAKYWVPHEGCEAYLSLIVVGDASDIMGGGVAFMDVERGRRLSISFVSDPERFRSEYRGPLRDLMGPPEPGTGRYNRVNLLIAHETGHLLGLSHPHDVSLGDGEYGTRFGFSSGWTVMSYQPGDRHDEFGAVDRENFQRMRAAYALSAAAKTNSSPIREALDAFDAYDWTRVHELLAPSLATSR